ncbi:MAG: hypothetical protein ACKO1L_01020 [Brachymonas sp.]
MKEEKLSMIKIHSPPEIGGNRVFSPLFDLLLIFVGGWVIHFHAGRSLVRDGVRDSSAASLFVSTFVPAAGR